MEIEFCNPKWDHVLEAHGLNDVMMASVEVMD